MCLVAKTRLPGQLKYLRFASPLSQMTQHSVTFTHSYTVPSSDLMYASVFTPSLNNLHFTLYSALVKNKRIVTRQSTIRVNQSLLKHRCLVPLVTPALDDQNFLVNWRPNLYCHQHPGGGCGGRYHVSLGGEKGR